MPNLINLDEERLRPLDREVAEKYFEVYNIEKPKFADDDNITEKSTKIEVSGKKKTKADIDDDHEGDW